MNTTTMRAAFGLMGTTAALALSLALPSPGAAGSQDATPTATYSCESVMGAAATPGAMGGMAMASPMAGMEMGIDLLYIDMMIPHHAGIIGLAEAALPRLTDERLQEIAQRIIDVQAAEIEELQALRETIPGSEMPMAMDDAHMARMMELMPGMGTMEEMAAQMDPMVQAQAFCAGEDPDLTFIKMTIAHHEMAITASEAALEQSTNDEVRAFAERVITDQQAEIEELQEIRAEQ